MIKKNIFLKNGLAAFLQKIIKTIDQLILIPFFITAWGAGFYGDWLTIMVVPTMIGFSDMGFGTSAANYFVLERAAGNKKNSEDIFASGFFAISVVVFLGIILSIGILIFGANLKIFSMSLIPTKDAIFAVSAMMAARFFAFYQQLYEARFNAARKSYLSILAQASYSLFGMIVNIVILSMGFGVVIFSFANLVVTVIYTVLYVVFAKKVLPVDLKTKPVVNKSDLRKIFKNGIAYLMAPVWQAIFFQGTTIVVRVILGPVAVTVFNTVRTVTRVVNQVYTMIISATLSELQFEIGRGNFLSARKIFRIGLLLTFLIAFLGMILLFFFGEYVYEFWTKKSLNPSTSIWNIFILGILFNSLWWPASFVFQAANKPRDLAISGVIAAIISVATSYFLTVIYGLSGAAVGSVMMDFLLCLYVLPRSCKLIGQSIFNLPREIFNDARKLLTINN